MSRAYFLSGFSGTILLLLALFSGEKVDHLECKNGTLTRDQVYTLIESGVDPTTHCAR